jgi:hypothetical protein
MATEIGTVDATDKAVAVLFPTFPRPVWLPRAVAEWIAELEQRAACGPAKTTPMPGEEWPGEESA